MKTSILKRWLVVALSAIATLGTGAAHSQELPAEVRLAWAGAPRVWVLARADKSFDKAFGVPVRWVQFASGADVISLFAANAIDIARFGSSPAVAGITQRLPIEVIGIPEVIATSERLTVRQNIASLKDIEGKTIAYPPNSTAQYALEAAIKVYKLDRSKIKLVPLSPNEIVAAWKRGDIDGAYAWDPASQQLTANGGHEIFFTKDLQKDGYLIYNNFVVRKAFAEKYPQIVTAFLKTYQQKVDEYQKDPEAAAQIISKNIEQPIESVRRTLAGLTYPSVKEQVSAAYLGNGASTRG
ncbi:ABC transporter substrate-binding protein [Pandoraea oxalativorans]|uniref:taurine ABC transporter substrate-binding protein n=1 Tax=Pandoraea oxalativorans TaxID=573737 RepID=UPI000A5A9685|nr:ABC transporter substrate-binding protein [Pandoraea oxalativorans]